MLEYATPVATNGTASTTATTWAPDRAIVSLKAVNRSNTNQLLISYDGGSNWFAILPNSREEVHGPFTSIQIKTDKGNAAYSLLAETRAN